MPVKVGQELMFSHLEDIKAIQIRSSGSQTVKSVF
jgi:hypothetical protein